MEVPCLQAQRQARWRHPGRHGQLGACSLRRRGELGTWAGRKDALLASFVGGESAEPGWKSLRQTYLNEGMSSEHPTKGRIESVLSPARGGLGAGKRGAGTEAGRKDARRASFVGQESRGADRKSLSPTYLQRQMSSGHTVEGRVESVLSPGKRPRRGQRTDQVASLRPLRRAESPGGRRKTLTRKTLREKGDAKDLVEGCIWCVLWGRNPPILPC